MIRRILPLLGSWIDALFAPAKDPREESTPVTRRQQELLARVRDARKRIEAVRVHLERGMEPSREEIKRLRDEARRLLHDDREDVARLVLRRRQAAVEHIRFLEDQIAQVDREAQTLAAIEDKLRTQIAAYYAHKDVASARFDAAEARVTVSEALSGISDELFDLPSTTGLTDERAEYMQARADAIDELVGLGVLPSSAVRPVNGFQVEDGDLDDEVEAVLRQIKSGVNV